MFMTAIEDFRSVNIETSSVQVWNAGISVKVFRQISLFIHYFYLFSKVMIRLDYQPPVRENEPALIPPRRREDQRPHPGDGGNRALLMIHTYIYFHTNRVYIYLVS